MSFIYTHMVTASIVVLTASASVQSGEITETLGTCHLIPAVKQIKAEHYDNGYRALQPRLIADAFFFSDKKRQAELALDQSEVQVIRKPQRGRLSEARSIHSVGELFSYYPDSNFVRNDRTDFLLTNKDGIQVKVIYFIKVGARYDSFTHPKVDMYLRYCPNPNTWKIP